MADVGPRDEVSPALEDISPVDVDVKGVTAEKIMERFVNHYRDERTTANI
jgi:hypothetical protein